jgi:hypothetical protein
MTFNNKVEAGTVLLGAAIGAIGALLINPPVLLFGATVAAAATGKRIFDRNVQPSASLETDHRRETAKVR